MSALLHCIYTGVATSHGNHGKVMELFWSWKKSWNSKNLPNSHGKVMEVYL